MSAGAVRVAITGKGGSGKTALAAIATGLLAKGGEQSILAIDADSALGLAHALGVEVHETVADIRREVIEDPQARKRMETRHVRDVMREVLEPGDGFRPHSSLGYRPPAPETRISTPNLRKIAKDPGSTPGAGHLQRPPPKSG